MVWHAKVSCRPGVRASAKGWPSSQSASSPCQRTGACSCTASPPVCSANALRRGPPAQAAPCGVPAAGRHGRAPQRGWHAFQVHQVQQQQAPLLVPRALARRAQHLAGQAPQAVALVAHPACRHAPALELCPQTAGSWPGRRGGPPVSLPEGSTARQAWPARLCAGAAAGCPGRCSQARSRSESRQGLGGSAGACSCSSGAKAVCRCSPSWAARVLFCHGGTVKLAACAWRGLGMRAAG